MKCKLLGGGFERFTKLGSGFKAMPPAYASQEPQLGLVVEASLEILVRCFPGRMF